MRSASTGGESQEMKLKGCRVKGGQYGGRRGGRYSLRIEISAGECQDVQSSHFVTKLLEAAVEGGYKVSSRCIGWRIFRLDGNFAVI